MDLTGKIFGCLQVLEKTNKEHYYLCKCDCGKTAVVLDRSLLCGYTKSCGHIQKQIASQTGTKTISANSKNRIKVDKKYNTNISVIKDTNLMFKNNKSGFRGIWWDKTREKWQAYIQLHNKKLYLGRFADIKDAITARKKAEEKFFKPIIELAKENNDIKEN